MRLYGQGEGSWKPSDRDLDAFEQVLSQQTIREEDLQIRASAMTNKLIERGFKFAIVIIDCDICAANSVLPGAKWAAYEHEGHSYSIFVVC